jgi:hypothetical protein
MIPVGCMNLLKRLASSTFVITILLLIAFDLFVSQVKPLMLVNETGLTGMNQNFLVSKLPEIMNSHDDRDVLLMGSSLVLVPAVRCDDELRNRKTRYDMWYYRNVIDTYSDADYFSDRLTTLTGKPVTVCNAAVAASVVSDDYLIAKKYLLSGKRPKLAIVCVAPREFLDALRADVTQTATHSVLSDFSTFYDDLRRGKSFSVVANSAFGLASTFYRTRNDYLTFVTAVAARTTGHPVNLFEAARAATTTAVTPVDSSNQPPEHGKSHPVYKQPLNKLGDIPSYKQMYLPINEKQFETQQSYFVKLLALFKENHVPTVVVDFPVTSENYALLPPDILKRYKEFLATTCSAAGVPVLKPADKVSFVTATDFEDSAHMNASGGNKLFNALSESIQCQRPF